jgi:hypothetical protein
VIWRRPKEPVAEVIALPPAPERFALTASERTELATRWAQVACIFCGGWHGGLCNRVRRVELDEAGRPRTTVFWEHWEPNPRTIWPEDVWGNPADMAQDLERQGRERQAQLEMQRVAAREAQRVRQEQQRPESPREIAARLTRGT